jgi:2-hydroxy-3-keto-5-methylthiopentenyl-1-phosphate phosphatase
MVSSDWNQCLAPCGPFDALIYCFPHLQPELDAIFRRYTSNAMTLTSAIDRIQSLIPAPLTEEDMDAYIVSRFDIYPGVVELMDWCVRNNILFMINTTGPMGYFQRVRAKGLLPALSALSASPFIQFNSSVDKLGLNYELIEIDDKGVNTYKVARFYGILPEHIIVIGDSGGDGPHFAWAAASGATTIGSMAKSSLIQYCRDRSITIGHCFGHTYSDGEPVAVLKEKRYNFMDLASIIGQVLGL